MTDRLKEIRERLGEHYSSHGCYVEHHDIEYLLSEVERKDEALKYYIDNCKHNPCDCLIARQALNQHGGGDAQDQKMQDIWL